MVSFKTYLTSQNVREKQTMTHLKNSLVSLLLFHLLRFCTSADTITPTRPVKDGDLLVSNGGIFALGFFSPNNSTNRYMGIWYHKVSEQTVVWVANRDNPIVNSTAGVLSIDKTGNLVLGDGNRGFPFWSSNVSAMRMAGNSSGQLLDTGNLVLFGGESKQDVAWQSFDHPTNTILPNMRFGLDRKTGLNRFITSWKSSVDPGIGEYSFKMDFFGSPQLFLYKGTTRIWRGGTWTGNGWSGVPQMAPNFIFKVTFIDNNDEVIAVYSMHNSSIFSRLVVNETGSVERLTWHEADSRWVRFWSAPKDQCDNYIHCGPFGYCNPYNPGSFECQCFPGFEPNSSRDWYLRDGSGGCARKNEPHMCGNGEGFVKLAHAKFPDTSTARVDMSLGLTSCQETCLKNCTCMGYTNADINGQGRGCITWYDNMVDTRQFLEGGQDLYIRADAVELAKYSKKSKSFDANRIVGIVVPLVIAVLLILVFAHWYMRKRRAKQRQREVLFDLIPSSTSFKGSSTGKEINETGANSDFHVFNLSTMITATENFSAANKLGEGGFGSVYKGQLQNGEEIAVKRLSNTSGQGMEEFKNEVTLIAKLQHRNLVRLLGCCIQKEEKMLIYEYLPNKGLDSFIFDEGNASLLDWKRRFEIILGIVRGLLYLHQDSRLRIIHRDLKASNVLLDATLNPKISDFGMARIFRGDQNEETTRRVVGTYGYMSPEYAMEGLFSVKSDVFSFGVLVLEIISGRKNNSYYLENSVNLIGHVWDLWGKEKALDVVDSSLGESFRGHEILRCIHVGLLCVQESANDRPTMPEVAFMLCNKETTLPSPNQPAFIFRNSNCNTELASASVGVKSVFDETITIVEAR